MYWSQIKESKKALRKMPVSAKAVLTTSCGKVLLLKKVSGIYDLPGGKVEAGEDLFKALKREIMEETGLKVKRFDFLASWVKQQPKMPPRLVVIFKAVTNKTAAKLPVKLSDEHVWFKFIAPKKALSKTMDPGFKNAIAVATRRKVKI